LKKASSKTVNFVPRPQKRNALTENLSPPQSNKRLKLAEKNIKRDSMLDNSFLINRPRYPRYNKTKQQPQQQQ